MPLWLKGLGSPHRPGGTLRQCRNSFGFFFELKELYFGVYLVDTFHTGTSCPGLRPPDARLRLHFEHGYIKLLNRSDELRPEP